MLEEVGTFVLTDSSLDRHSERVLVEGVDFSDFEKNAVMFYNHHRSEDAWWGDADATKILPIGTWKNIRREGGQILADGYVNTEDSFGEKVASAIRNEVLKAVSIGFIALAYSDAEEDKVTGQKGVTITKSQLREASIVDIPSNPNALRVKNISEQIREKKESGESVEIGEKTFYKICHQQPKENQKKETATSPQKPEKNQEMKKEKKEKKEEKQDKGGLMDFLFNTKKESSKKEDMTPEEVQALVGETMKEQLKGFSGNLSSAISNAIAPIQEAVKANQETIKSIVDNNNEIVPALQSLIKTNEKEAKEANKKKVPAMLQMKTAPEGTALGEETGAEKETETPPADDGKVDGMDIFTDFFKSPKGTNLTKFKSQKNK